MRKLVFATLVLLAALPLAAQDYEQFMLPIAPSVVMCGYHSRYDTRLLVFNDNDRAVARYCSTADCAGLASKTGIEVSGDYAGGTPVPRFLYIPKADAAGLRMSIMIESSEQDHPEERSFTEVPVVRASDFTDGRINFILRMDPGFRQTVRIYGLDGSRSAQVKMRIYPLEGGKAISWWLHDLHPLGDAELMPSFGMECDLSEYVEAKGQQVRIELEPKTPGRYWGFISVTNNRTQHFYTVLPR